MHPILVRRHQPRGDGPGVQRAASVIFHTYSTYGRGVEAMLPAYRLLDLTSLGRQEPWEEPVGRAATVYRHDRGVLSPEIAGVPDRVEPSETCH